MKLGKGVNELNECVSCLFHRAAMLITYTFTGRQYANASELN